MGDLSMMPDAAFAVAPDSQVSARYGFVSTRNVVEALIHEGWAPTGGNQTRARRPGGQAFAKHVVRLRRQDAESRFREVGDAVPELVIINSHDATSAFQVRTGIFRLVCSNGMVLPVFEGEGVRIIHRMGLVDDVLRAAERVAAGFSSVAEQVLRWQRLRLSAREAQQFAERALRIRWASGPAPIPAADLLAVRRTVDAGDDLWRVFNRVQENLLRAGMRTRNSAGRRMTVRPIRSVQRDVGINSALWAEACKVERQLAA